LRQTSTRTSRNIELRNTWSSLNPTTRYKQRGSLLSLGLRSCPQRITSGRRAHPCSSSRRHLSTGPASQCRARTTTQAYSQQERPAIPQRARPGRNVADQVMGSSMRYLCATAQHEFAKPLRSSGGNIGSAFNCNRFGKLPSTTFPRRSHYRGQSTTDKKPSSSVTHLKLMMLASGQ
jgi:hypothetical protein